MTDQAAPVAVPTDPTASPVPSVTTADLAAGGGPKKSPLDLLEDILNQAQAAQPPGAPTTSPTSPAAATDAPPVSSRDAEYPVQTEEELARLKAEEAERDARDQAAAAAQLAAIQAETTSPENQARLQQESAQQQAHTQQTQAQEGYEIVQLGHTKL